MTLLDRFNEGFGRYDNVGRGINDGHFYRRAGLGEVQGRVRFGFDLVAGHGCSVCSD